MKEVLTDDNVVGGINGALGAGFTDGIGQVFKPTPDAAMYYEGGFVYGIATGDTNKDLKWGETIQWFDFPSFGQHRRRHDRWRRHRGPDRQARRQGVPRST